MSDSEDDVRWNYVIIDQVEHDDECMDDEILKIKGAENLLYLHYRSPSGTDEKPRLSCQLCNAQKTPLWRRFGEWHTLCNACGIRIRTKYRKNQVNL